ncbi:FMN-binding protein [Arcanobacterium bovis]|uniref:FMN-binding protein n=1 Tax=Arcanobacterium bovis TaxID=2529275 RepID=A0A4Q9UYR1_9ACTO|nr:FMN-binding protein [Arcanobacterium bovis]TBW20834.1 FMN-binding protein [Arcanobacterium bovis]
MKATRKGIAIGSATLLGTLGVLASHPVLQLVQNSQGPDQGPDAFAQAEQDPGTTVGANAGQSTTKSAQKASTSANNSTVSSSGSSSGSSSSGSASSSTSSAQGTAYEGTARNKYGTTQVRAWVNNGKITDIKVLKVPGDHESQHINSRAMPTLVEEALQKQSAQVSGISGATYSVKAFKQSLQAALDQAGIN